MGSAAHRIPANWRVLLRDRPVDVTRRGYNFLPLSAGYFIGSGNFRCAHDVLRLKRRYNPRVELVTIRLQILAIKSRVLHGGPFRWYVFILIGVAIVAISLAYSSATFTAASTEGVRDHPCPNNPRRICQVARWLARRIHRSIRFVGGPADSSQEVSLDTRDRANYCASPPVSVNP
jgi:hypothetical protein